jgi:hypothetical protein
MPIYAGATQLQVKDNEYPKVYSFETTDGREDVIDYYRRVLQDDGWELAPSKALTTAVQQDSDISSLYFNWYDLNITNGHLLRVTASSTVSGTTRVLIEMFRDRPR